MPINLGSTPAPFSVEDLTVKGRSGSLPPGYMNAYLAHIRRSHAAAQAVIDGLLANAPDDPVELARLRDFRSEGR